MSEIQEINELTKTRLKTWILALLINAIHDTNMLAIRLAMMEL